jgi:uncharacterized membrane protein
MDYTTITPNNAALRACARAQLTGKWGSSALVTLLYLLLLACFEVFIQYVFESQNSNIVDFFIEIVPYVILIAPIDVGYCWYFLRIARGEPTTLQNLFDGYQPCFKVISTYLICTILLIFWFLLLIVPGVIKSCSYAMTFFILRDNPNLGAWEAITESQRMMNGYKKRYFVLLLSFTGWFLLCILSLGIGFFWLLPYISLTEAKFYESIKQNLKS